ncbi:BAG family molecular chaperone regulator 1-like protein [Drosera capensis]
MMRMKTRLTSPTTAAGGGGVGGEETRTDWEVRPGGLLVQKRSDSDLNSAPPAPTIKVRVKYGASYHEISMSSQATFGELKKKLQGATGLHHQDQKLLYKDKERDSNAFLDIVGLKDKSKVVLIEDPISQEKRYIEMRKNAKMEKAVKSISEISFEVDRLSAQVSTLELAIKEGGKVAEKEVLNLTELLMNELVKLDAIVAAGEVKLQRKMQVRRVQKYVETLDLIKAKNSMATDPDYQVPNKNQQKQSNGHLSNGKIADGHTSNGHKPYSVRHQKPGNTIGHSPLRPPRPPPHPQSQRQEEPRKSTSATVVTTQWETFESGSPLIPLSSPEPQPPLVQPSSASASAPSISTTANTTSNHKFNWEIF